MALGTISMQIMLRTTPMSRVLAKPRMVPVPFHRRTKPAIMVVILESRMAVMARRKPASTALRRVLPEISSSRMRS